MSNNSADSQHDIIGINDLQKTYARTTHPDAQWFRDAGLGLFLHWGLSSVGGNMDLSWGMIANTPYDGEMYNTNKMKPTEYWNLAERFSPNSYNPERWLEAARKAGFTYAVLTTRHHEGFALWPSAHGDFNTKNFLGGRDLVNEYVTACRNTGMKVGFYYSPPDWRWCKDYMSFNYRSGIWPEHWIKKHPDAYALVPHETWDEHWLPREPVETMPREKEKEFARYVRGQILELLGNYGKIDIMWFDGNPFETLLPVTVEEIRSLQPGILINPRLHGTVDFTTPENQIPETKPEGWWEGCFIWNKGSWGYSACERYETTGWFLDILAHHRTWDGNLLMNCAPRPDGEMPETYYLRMTELAAWMEKHRETVFGVTGGPYPESSDVPVTISPDGTWYLHLTQKKACMVTGKGVPLSAAVHGSGNAVYTRAMGDKTIFALNYADMTDLDDVICVRWAD